MTIADILDKAADLIEPEGRWGQGSKRRQNCAVEAIGEAGGGMCAVDAVRDYLGVISLSAWNDAPERTQAEVVAKLREAAKLARESGK